MMGLSNAKFWRIVCSQKVDFPDPGGPTSNIKFLGGTSCIWVRETNNYPIYKVADASLFKLRLVSKLYLGIYLKTVALGYTSIPLADMSSGLC